MAAIYETVRCDSGSWGVRANVCGHYLIPGDQKKTLCGRVILPGKGRWNGWRTKEESYPLGKYDCTLCVVKAARRKV